MKLKPLLAAIILVAIIGGALLSYNALTDSVQKPELAEIQARQPEQSDAGESSSSPEADDRIKAPNFTVTDINGNSVRLSDFLGMPVVLNFWASWCPPCKSEMPEFDAVYKELGENVHFMMVDAVDGQRETREKGAAYIAAEGVSFPVYYDMEQDAVIQYGIRAFPTSIFIDSEGYVVAGVEGTIEEAILRKGIELITEKPAAKQ